MGAQCFDFPTRPSCAARGLYARTLACAPTFVESIGLGAALLAPAVTRVARRLFFFSRPVTLAAPEKAKPKVINQPARQWNICARRCAVLAHVCASSRGRLHF